MPIEIVHADRSMLHAVLANLRAADLREMTACETNLAMLPHAIMQHRVFAFCACDYDLGPVAAWGMIRRRQGVGAGFAFGTIDWGKALLPMLHQIHNFVLPFLVINNWHRVEALALADRDDVGRFMELIGAHPEAVLDGYGVGGEDFISYRWLANEYDGTGSDRNQKAARANAAH